MQRGSGQGLAIRQGGIDALLLPCALAHHIGKHPQLTNRPPALTFKTRPWQAAFLHGSDDEIIPDGQDFSGNCFKKYRPFSPASGAVCGEGISRSNARGGDLGSDGRRGRLGGIGHGYLPYYSDILS